MTGGGAGLLLSINCQNQTLGSKVSDGGQEEWLNALVAKRNDPSSDPQYG